MQAKMSNLKIWVSGNNNLLLQSRFNSSAQSLCGLDENKIERERREEKRREEKKENNVLESKEVWFENFYGYRKRSIDLQC
jgi:hypothetical protein